MKELEREILVEARRVFHNPKLRIKDIQEWSTGPVKAQHGEVVAVLGSLGINVAIKTEQDKRAVQ